MDQAFEDEEIVNRIVNEYSGLVRGICRRFYLANGTAEDLYQEGMIGLLEATKKFDKSRGKIGDESFKKFATICIKRKVIDAIRNSNAKKNQVLNNSISLMRTNFEDEEFELEELGGAENPEDIYILLEKKEEQVKELFTSLSEFETQVVELYLEGKSVKEISGLLNKTPRSITNTIQRIKLKMKK